VNGKGAGHLAGGHLNAAEVAAVRGVGGGVAIGDRDVAAAHVDLGLNTAEEEHAASGLADQGIDIAVIVDIRQGGVTQNAQVYPIEGRLSAGDLDKKRCGGCAVIAEVVEDAVILAGQGIQVAVAVDIGQRRRGKHSNVHAVEGSAGAGGWDERGSYGRTHVDEKVDKTIRVADQRIEVTVAIQVAEGGFVHRARNHAVEGVEFAAHLFENRRRGCSGIAVEIDRTLIRVGVEQSAHEGVQVVVIVDIDQGWGCQIAKVEPVEGGIFIVHPYIAGAGW